MSPLDALGIDTINPPSRNRGAISNCPPYPRKDVKTSVQSNHYPAGLLLMYVNPAQSHGAE